MSRQDDVIPALSVVVPVFNGVPELRDLLRSLIGESVIGGFEVVIADNGSSDGTRELALEFQGPMDLRVIDVPTRGVSAARNAGIGAARARSVVLLDHDDLVAPGYLQAMSAALASASLVASRIEVQSSSRWSTGRVVPQVRSLGEGWRPWAYGATLGFRRSVFDAIGGFDEDLVGSGGDDVDFCWRAQMSGAELRWVPNAVVRYRIPDGARKLFKQGWFYGRGGARIALRFEPFGFESPGIARQVRRLIRLVASASVGRTPIRRIPFLVGRNLGYLYRTALPIPCRGVESDGRLSAR